MTPTLAMAGALGALVLLTPEGKRAASVVVQAPSSGANAITRTLASKRVGGVALAVTANGSPFDAFAAQLRAFVARYGAQSGGAGGYPATMPVPALVEWLDAWLAAYEAGASDSAATAEDFALTTDSGPGRVASSKLAYQALVNGWALYGSRNYRTWPLTPLGKALGSVLDWKRTGLADADATIGAILIQETVDRLRLFAGELEGVSYTFPGARPSEQGATFDTVMGGIGAAAGASVEFVADTAGKFVDGAGELAGGLLGSAAGAIVRHPVFWAGVLGYLAWRHMT